MEERSGKKTAEVSILAAPKNQPEDDEFMFLDGCKIFLSGYSAQQVFFTLFLFIFGKEQQFVQMITICGGTRLKVYDQCVTHFVVDYITEESVKPLTTLSSTPKVVNSKWLEDCYKVGGMMVHLIFRSTKN